MKIRGDFVIRQVLDSIIAVPTGQTALQLNKGLQGCHWELQG